MTIGILKKKHYTAVSWYRLTPWAYLARQTGAKVMAIDIKAHNQYDLAALDVLVCHSPSTINEQNIILSASRHGVKLIFDYDDLLFEIDDTNPAQAYWGSEEVQINAIEIMVLADVITVSTKALQNEFLRRFRVESVVIPNGINDFAQRIWPTIRKRKERLIMWRGSNTHEGDLKVHKDAFIELQNAQYLFFGYRPNDLSKRYGGHLDKVPYTKGIRQVEFYFDHLRNIGPKFLVVPLDDTPFNRCKSNIAAQEAIWAGAIPIVPDYMPEFADIPAIHYDSVEGLRDVFHAIDKSKEFPGVLQAGREDMELRWMLSSINNKRLRVVNDLFAPAAPPDIVREGGSTL